MFAEFAKVEGIDMGTVVEITDQVFDEVGKDHP